MDGVVCGKSPCLYQDLKTRSLLKRLELCCKMMSLFLNDGDLMLRFAIVRFFSLLVDWLCVRRLTDTQKGLEVLLLPYQFVIARRHLHHPPHSVEKVTLAILPVKFKTLSRHPITQLRSLIHLVQPETVYGGKTSSL